MNQKSAQSDKTSSAGFIGLPVLLIVVIATIAVTAKSIYDKSHVLGQSAMLAQEAQAPAGGAPPAQSAPQQPQSQPSQPQQQPSQPQGQPSQPQEQPQQNSQPQQPAQNNPGSQPQQMQPGQQNPQMNPQNYQPNMQKLPENQKQMQQLQNPQDNNNYSQNNQGSQPGKYNGGQQQFGNQQNQQGGQNPNEQTRPGNNPQQIPAQDQQRYEKMQQQFQQEADKHGFSISGNMPNQYFQQSQQNNAQGSGSTFQALPSPKDFATISGEFKVKSADGTSVDINDGNTKIQLGTNNSNLSLNAIRPDGKRIEIDKTAFEAVVAAMKAETGSEVSQKGDAFTFKRGAVEADTKFPISFDVTTKTFSVQTSNGEKEVAVLPDQAVEKLMENKVFSQLQTSTSTAPSVTLTELDNQPVYQVQGIIQKKFLGFVPISIAKTSYVSAQTGDSVKTDISAFSRLLDITSF